MIKGVKCTRATEMELDSTSAGAVMGVPVANRARKEKKVVDPGKSLSRMSLKSSSHKNDEGSVQATMSNK